MEFVAFILFGGLMFWVGYTFGIVTGERREIARERALFERSRGADPTAP